MHKNNRPPQSLSEKCLGGGGDFKVPYQVHIFTRRETHNHMAFIILKPAQSTGQVSSQSLVFILKETGKMFTLFIVYKVMVT